MTFLSLRGLFLFLCALHSTDGAWGAAPKLPPRNVCFASARALCDSINLKIGERFGSSSEEAREAMQAEVDALGAETARLYGIYICEAS